MKRRDFLKAALAVPVVGVATARGADVLTPKAKECIAKPYHVCGQPIDLGPCGSNYVVNQLWVTPAHPDLTTNFQCLIGDNWATIICVPPGNKIHIQTVPMWALESSSRMRIMYEVKE